jgi:hypothetical protein
VSATILPDVIGWRVRQPTVQECELVGRDVLYAEPVLGSSRADWGDVVVETDAIPEAQAKLAEAFEMFGWGDDAHVIPAGVYLEE